MRPPSPCCDPKDNRKGPWTPEEDANILAHVSKHGTGNWISVPKRAGLRRCSKSCRLRRTNYLRPNLKPDSFTAQEEDLIIKLHAAIGSRWSIIAQQLPGRKDNDVKNYWNTKLRKKLKEIGIDPVTHRPFSQILRDYGNMGGSTFGTLIKPINRDMKSTSSSYPFKLEPSSSIQPQMHPNINTQQMISEPTTQRPPDQGFLAKTNNSNSNCNSTYEDQSLDLLAQLQAIKMVTDTSLCSQYEPGYLLGCNSLSSSLSSSPTSSSSCSSSACSTAIKDKSPSQNFSWSDFLLEDANLLTTDPQVPQKMPEFPFQDFSSQVQNVSSQGDLKNETGQDHEAVEKLHYNKTGCVLKDPLPSSSSFVEAMINRDKEMVMEFPEIWEETLYY